jgi:single-strand DNA-binding protein
MNSVNLTARLTRDPETREAVNGNTVGSLRVAIPRPRKNGQDAGADYVDVTVWGPLAKTCGQYLSKGRQVAIEGHLHHSEWDSDNGRRQKLEVVARSVEFLGGPRRDDNGDDVTEDTSEPVGVAGDEDIAF